MLVPCRSASSITSSSPDARRTASNLSRYASLICFDRGCRQHFDSRQISQCRWSVEAGARAMASADLHGPREVAATDLEQETTVLIKDGSRRIDALHAGEPSVRCGGLGRIGVSIHLQRRRLRADHRPDPPASSGPANVRGRQGSWSARSPPECSTPTPRRSRCLMLTRTCSPALRSCIMSGARLRQPAGVEEASFTLHPRGIPHGPHPGTIVASKSVRARRTTGRNGRYIQAPSVDPPRPSSWTTRLIP